MNQGGNEETLFTIDNVALDLPVAGLGSRVLAVLVDYLAVAAASIVWVIAAIAIGAALDLEAWTIALVVVGLFVIDWGYFSGFEIGLRGRTPGKVALGLRVVSRTGGAVTPGALVVRNLLRLPDLLVGVLLMAVDPLSRRLGDRLAGTLVVHQTRPHAEVVIRRVPAGWGAREVALAEALLARAAGMEPGRAEELARRLIAHIERVDPGFRRSAPSAGPVEDLRQLLEGGVD